jgi:hypothetical protein
MRISEDAQWKMPFFLRPALNGPVRIRNKHSALSFPLPMVKEIKRGWSEL